MTWVPVDGHEFPSLGWGLVDWVADTFDVPAGPLAGEPFILNDDQVEAWVRWFAIDPDTGLFVFSAGTFIGPVGCGKSPGIGSLMALAYLFGPVVFDGWDDHGQPVGVPLVSPSVQILATAEDQTGNCYLPARDMAAASPAATAAGVDAGDTRIRLKGRPGALEFKTSSAGPRLGDPTHFAVMDETQLWTPRNRGTQLAQTVRNNAEKTNYAVGRMIDPRTVTTPDSKAVQSGRTFAITNMPHIGENSVAEHDLETLAADDDFLLIERRGDDVTGFRDPTNTAKVEASLRKAYGASLVENGGHVPLEGRVRACRSAKYTDAWIRRMYLSVPVRGELGFVDVPTEWEPLTVPRDLLDNEPVVLSLDPSMTEDCTVLRAFAVGDTEHDVKPYTFRHPEWVWARPDDAHDWRVNPADVHTQIVAAIDAYNVQLVIVDPMPWSSTFRAWARDGLGNYGEPGGLLMTQSTNQPARFGPMLDDFRSAMRRGDFTHDGDPTAAEHLTNAVEAKRGQHTAVTKPRKGSAFKIDDVITLALGWAGVQIVLDHSNTTEQPFYDIVWT